MARHAGVSATDPALADIAANNDDVRTPARDENDAPETAFMAIGEVAQAFGVTLRTLRFYEAKRLIAPRRHGSARLYSRADRERLSLILTGRRLGFTLAEITKLLGRPDGKGLHLTRQQCLMQINLLEQRKRGIEVAIAELRQIYTSFYRKLLDNTDEPSR